MTNENNVVLSVSELNTCLNDEKSLKIMETVKSTSWKQHVENLFQLSSNESLEMPHWDDYQNPQMACLILSMVMEKEPSRQRKQMKQLLIASDEMREYVDDPDQNGTTALHWACIAQNPLALRFLLKVGKANVHKQTKYGFTALHLAVGKYWMWNNSQEKEALDILELLIQAGSPVNAVTSHGSTALHEAAQYGHSKAIRILLKTGANPGISDNTGKCAVEFVQDMEIRKLVHKAYHSQFTSTSSCNSSTTTKSCCSYCQKDASSPSLTEKQTTTTLASCSRCNDAVYCCRECQIAHWKQEHKKICLAYATARPLTFDVESYGGRGQTTNIECIAAGQLGPQAAFLGALGKRFIVKVMRPLNDPSQRVPCHVQNQDRSIVAYVFPNDRSFQILIDIIRTKGVRKGCNPTVQALTKKKTTKTQSIDENNHFQHYDEGIKAYFWATKISDFAVAVFPACIVPEQLW